MTVTWQQTIPQPSSADRYSPLIQSQFKNPCSSILNSCCCICLLHSVDISVHFNAAHVFFCSLPSTWKRCRIKSLQKQSSFPKNNRFEYQWKLICWILHPPLHVPPLSLPFSNLSGESPHLPTHTLPALPPPPPPPLLSLTHQLVFLPCFHRAVRPTLTGPTPDRPHPGAPCPSL